MAIWIFGSGADSSGQLPTGADSSVTVRLLEADTARLVASSHPLSGDFICQDVSWLDDLNLADWAGMPVLLEFALSGAALYAFQFVEDLSGHDSFGGVGSIPRCTSPPGKSYFSTD